MIFRDFGYLIEKFGNYKSNQIFDYITHLLPRCAQNDESGVVGGGAKGVQQKASGAKASGEKGVQEAVAGDEGPDVDRQGGVEGGEEEEEMSINGLHFVGFNPELQRYQNTNFSF